MIKIIKRKSKFTKDGIEHKLKSYSHYLQLYKIYIVIIFGDKRFKEYRDLYDIKTTPDAMCCNEIQHCREVMFLFNDKPSESVVAHECVHASNMILESINFKPTNYDSDEINAYLTEYLVEVVLKAKKKYKK